MSNSKITPICIGCGKHPAELEEYVENDDDDRISSQVHSWAVDSRR